MTEKNYVMTIDVEDFSYETNSYDKNIIERVHNEALPKILDIFLTNEIRATFFFTGYFAKHSPESLRMVINEGHEVGCHSYSHLQKNSLDNLDIKQQIRQIAKSKLIIESVVGKIQSFRAPALRINKFTHEALIHLGFKYDSSTSPKRFDGPFSHGSLNKMKWLLQPYGIRKIYSKHNTKKYITEIPITSFFLPYISTINRISPNLFDIIREISFSRISSYQPILYLMHPDECLDYKSMIRTERRNENLIGYFFGDYIRHKLKFQNLGNSSLRLLEKEIKKAREYGFNFLRIKDL